MRTLYIDVYFLINFTVDILALYFSSVFSKTPTNSRRLIISALLCAFTTVLIVFLPEIPLLKIIATAVTLCFVGGFAIKKVALKRKIKFAFCFLVVLSGDQSFHQHQHIRIVKPTVAVQVTCLKQNGGNAVYSGHRPDPVR